MSITTQRTTICKHKALLNLIELLYDRQDRVAAIARGSLNTDGSAVAGVDLVAKLALILYITTNGEEGDAS